MAYELKIKCNNCSKESSTMFNHAVIESLYRYFMIKPFDDEYDVFEYKKYNGKEYVCPECKKKDILNKNYSLATLKIGPARTKTDKSLETELSQNFTKKDGCFIATATFDSYNAPEVIFFRNWRDDFLIKSLLGRLFIYIYYRVSPVFAKYIKRHLFLKSGSKYLLTKLITFID